MIFSSARVHLLRKSALIAVIAMSMSACSSSGSSSPAPESNNGTGGDDANESAGGETQETNLPTSGAYDLAAYSFHLNVLTDGGEISFEEKIYGKVDNGDGSVFSIDRAFINKGGAIEELSNNEVIKKFTVTATGINEEFLDTGDSRVAQRFVDIGDEFLNADSKPVELGGMSTQQNATCVLLEHLDNFDLSTATGDLALASGVYEDVLKVECITGFLVNGTVSPHTTLRNYFAKDIGVVFSEGNLLFFDDVYIIDEY